jgi:hypothetical protein
VCSVNAIAGHFLEFDWNVGKYFTGQDIKENSIFVFFYHCDLHVEFDCQPTPGITWTKSPQAFGIRVNAHVGWSLLMP